MRWASTVGGTLKQLVIGTLVAGTIGWMLCAIEVAVVFSLAWSAVGLEQYGAIGPLVIIGIFGAIALNSYTVAFAAGSTMIAQVRASTDREPLQRTTLLAGLGAAGASWALILASGGWARGAVIELEMHGVSWQCIVVAQLVAVNVAGRTRAG